MSILSAAAIGMLQAVGNGRWRARPHASCCGMAERLAADVVLH